MGHNNSLNANRPNGHTYEGHWQHGKQHGQGWLTKSGERKCYIWENGKRVRELTQQESDSAAKTVASTQPPEEAPEARTNNSEKVEGIVNSLDQNRADLGQGPSNGPGQSAAAGAEAGPGDGELLQGAGGAAGNLAALDAI